MRINLGIRRRLAPLLENSRRRIELLTSLLFSLPGTPILYYGDEIGMGDNIYLGDRNGVRTPMQWSGDRNAGFSRADPARLYAPPVMDPVYGYQAINVEAQERTPFSLLQWTKRLIAMRRQHKVFGRGSLEIVYPSNRKVLAFLRRDEHETVLVVANLARTVQPVELDLSAFNGLTPVEMVGQTEFPRIADRPYFLALGPHTAYWFSLVQAPVAVTQLPPRQAADVMATVAEALPSLMVGADWHGVLDSSTRTILERQALGPFLKRQRWFGSKGREIKQARFSDWATIQRGPEPAFATVVSVSYGDAWVDSYTLPLALLSGDAAAAAIRDRPTCVLARSSTGSSTTTSAAGCSISWATRRRSCRSAAACAGAERHRRRSTCRLSASGRRERVTTATASPFSANSSCSSSIGASSRARTPSWRSPGCSRPRASPASHRSSDISSTIVPVSSPGQSRSCRRRSRIRAPHGRMP
jgi:maltose alpha-D-glucosyltransferase/alpha-amylase